MKNELPVKLKEIVHISLERLGVCISEIYGKHVYRLVESVRKETKELRTVQLDSDFSKLKKYLNNLEKLDSKQLSQITHSFSIYLELVNRCEQAYREHRIQQKKLSFCNIVKPYRSIYVFTAHPTEARSQTVIHFFNQIEVVLVDFLNGAERLSELDYYLSLLLQTPMAVHKKPLVKDECENIYTTILSKRIIEKQIELLKKDIQIEFRCWAGGDKDGHPFVDEKAFVESLSISRQYLIEFLISCLEQHNSSFIYLNDKLLNSWYKSLKRKAELLKSLKNNDGNSVVEFRKNLISYNKKMIKRFKIHCPFLEKVERLIWLYPALVVPLEFREDSQLVRESLNDSSMTIVKMFKKLKSISKGHESKWYVRGFILSMCESSEDLKAGLSLLKRELGSYAIPLVPLFETKFALENSKTILIEHYKNKSIIQKHKKDWGSRFEIMLGYSDSSKESGSFVSRLFIGKTMLSLDKFLKKYDLIPVFFHGSGGSIERGGGSVQQQISWWPKSALNIYKSTIQGEMINRNFSNPYILESNTFKVLSSFSNHSKSTAAFSNSLVKKFANEIKQNYQGLLERVDFIDLIQGATPYPYLDQLKIGSRPTKRQKDSKEFKLRAIPWVLCWTQTRTLIPTWWGVGSAWESLNLQEKKEFISIYNSDDFLDSFLKILGFTLAKIDLSIFKLYLSLGLNKSDVDLFYSLFINERQKTVNFFKEITGEDEFLWFRPWLQESITLRSAVIHPLNLIQLIALKNKDYQLLRETVTGISCGMMTTG